MARQFLTLMARKIGPSTQNLVLPQLIYLTTAQITAPIRKNKGTYIGSTIVKANINGYNQKFEILESAEQINAQVDPTVTPITANTAFTALGANQGAAAPLLVYLNVVTTATTGTADGALLPAATVGKVFVVQNPQTFVIKVYPATGEKINSLTANTAFQVPAKGSTTFGCATIGVWTAVTW